MKRQLCRRSRVGALLLVAAALVAGCGQEIEISQYPEFYDPDDPSKNIKSVVVLPFRNQAPRAGRTKAGEAMSEELAGLLGGSGTYAKVFNRKNLSNLMDQQDLHIAAGGDPTAMAGALKRRGAVEAMITGAVTFYTATPPKSYVIQVPVPTYNPYTRQWGIKLQNVTMYKSSAQVTATATLLRVGSGTPVHATGPATESHVADGLSPVPESQCLALARGKVVSLLSHQFVVVRRRITVDSDAFLVASKYYDGRWTDEDEFTTNDDKAYVVLKLPSVCDRNRFRITIVREGGQDDLFVEKVRWLKGSQTVYPGGGVKADSAKVGMGFEFNPSQIAAKGGGPGTYVAKFYAGPEPTLTVAFDIEAPQ